MAALEARYGRGAFREEIDDFTLALIAPLGADDDYEFTHALLPLADQEENHHADEHAAQSGNAQLAVADFEELRESTLHAAWIDERSDAFEHEEQPQRGEQIRQVQRHGSGSRPAQEAVWLMGAVTRAPTACAPIEQLF